MSTPKTKNKARRGRPHPRTTTLNPMTAGLNTALSGAVQFITGVSMILDAMPPNKRKELLDYLFKGAGTINVNYGVKNPPNAEQVKVPRAKH